MLDRIGIDGLKKFAFEDRPVQDCVD
jgi:hypothetical protein